MRSPAPPKPNPDAWDEGFASLPTHARIEASATCQLKCPSCPTASGAIRPAIAPGYLKPAAFERFLDSSPSLRKVELSNYGEVFLNPELATILAIAAKRGVTLSIANGANLNRMDKSIASALVKAGVALLTCSIDGATQETYARYRVKGDLESVLANIDAINAAKRRHKSRTPLLVWQFVVFGHNEHEIGMAKAMATARGMRFLPKLSWDTTFSPIRDEDAVRRETALPASREESKAATGRNHMRWICRQLWIEPQFNWNGANLGCCRNFWGDFGGNVLTEGFEATFNGERMRQARRMLLGRVKPAADIPCASCELFLDMQETGDYLSRAEILAKGSASPPLRPSPSSSAGSRRESP